MILNAEQSGNGKPPASGWTWIDNQVIDRAAEIGANALAVYVVLSKYADEFGECYPSHGEIGDTLGISEDTVQRALKSLKSVDLISWRRKGRGRGQGSFNIYTLALRNRTGADSKAVTKPQIPVTKPQISPLRNRTGAARTRTKNKNHLEQEPNKAPVVFPDDLDTVTFRTMWTDWEQHRREIKKALKPSTRKRQLAKCSAWGVERAVRSIEASIEHGWTGLFDPDQKGKRNGKSTTNTGVGQRFRTEGYGTEGVF